MHSEAGVFLPSVVRLPIVVVLVGRKVDIIGDVGDVEGLEEIEVLLHGLPAVACRGAEDGV